MVLIDSRLESRANSKRKWALLCPTYEPLKWGLCCSLSFGTPLYRLNRNLPLDFCFSDSSFGVSWQLASIMLHYYHLLLHLIVFSSCIHYIVLSDVFHIFFFYYLFSCEGGGLSSFKHLVLKLLTPNTCNVRSSVNFLWLFLSFSFPSYFPYLLYSGSCTDVSL